MSNHTYTPSAQTIFWLDRASYPRWVHLPLAGGAVALLVVVVCLEPIAAVPVALIAAFGASVLALRGYLIPVDIALEERALVVVRERMYTQRPKVIRVALDDIVCVSLQWQNGRDIGLLVHTRSMRVPLDLALAAYRVRLNRSGIELRDNSMREALCQVLHARGVTIGRPPSLLARLRARMTGNQARIREEQHAPPAEPFIAPGWLTVLRTSAMFALPLALALMFGIPQLGASTPSSNASYAVKPYRGHAPVYVSETLGVVHSAAFPIAFAWFLAAAAADARLRHAHRRRGSG